MTDDTPTPQRLIRPSRLAEALGCHPSSISRMIANGALPRPRVIFGIRGWLEKDLPELTDPAPIRDRVRLRKAVRR